MYASDARFGVTSTTHTRHVRAHAGARPSTARTWRCRLLYGGGGLRQAGARRRGRTWPTCTRSRSGASARACRPGGRWRRRTASTRRSGHGWRVGSSGFVRQDSGDQGYAITVMTEGASNQRTGIRLAEEVARRAAGGAHRRSRREPADRPGQVRAHEQRRVVDRASTARLGLPSSRAGEVRTTSGGNPSPLSGQQACSPDIPGEAVSPSSSVNGRYRRGRHRSRLRRPRRPALVRPGRRRRRPLGRAPRPPLPLAVDERHRRLRPGHRRLRRRRLRRRALVRPRHASPTPVVRRRAAGRRASR